MLDFNLCLIPGLEEAIYLRICSQTIKHVRDTNTCKQTDSMQLGF